jgi:flagellar assembly protein FliH
VDEEEKISLSKPTRHTLQGGLAEFGLHCFPDIRHDESAKARPCLATEENFQRINYEDLGSKGTDMASRPDDDGACSIRKGSISTAQLNEQAYQRGLADGRKQGMIDAENSWHEFGEKKIEPLLMCLQEVLLQLNNIRNETYQEIEKEVVELALAIAKQVICREITIDRDIVVCVAREALAKVEDPGRVKIKMNPCDLQFANETRSQLSNLIQNIENVTLEAAEKIQSGGCIIETDLGEIDARIENQLQAVEESFRTAMGKLEN